MQQRFRLLIASPLLALCFLLLSRDHRYQGPDRTPLPPRLAPISYDPVAISEAAVGPFKLYGVWRVEVDDPRFGGLSGLAVTGRGLLALTDSGVLVEFPRPRQGRMARLRELPAGPGYPNFRRFRDSEALALDAQRQGWWVTFENRHSLWFYDREFSRGRRALALRGLGWPVNKGVEGLVRTDRELLLFVENGHDLLMLGDREIGRARLGGASAEISEAVRLPDGRILVSLREIGVLGITNRLAWLERTTSGREIRPIGALPVGPLDNVEGLAAERLPNGATRLWAVTDNDGWRRTLLLALDLPNNAKPPASGSGRLGESAIR